MTGEPRFLVRDDGERAAELVVYDFATGAVIATLPLASPVQLIRAGQDLIDHGMRALSRQGVR